MFRQWLSIAHSQRRCKCEIAVSAWCVSVNRCCLEIETPQITQNAPVSTLAENCVNKPQRNLTPSRHGFTLIELVVVMAIIAILALMAVPTFHDKYIREQVIEAMRLTDIAKAPIGIAWSTTKTFPDDNAAAGLPVADKVVSNYVKSLTVEAGAIHVVFGNQANGALRGKTLSLRPAVIEDAPIVPVAWVCGFAAAPEKMTVMAANKTDLPKSWLPVNCR